jgi:2OG-Fe(II) oxygenase superfamily
MADVGGVLAGRRWLRRTWPFPHVVAQEVFRPDFYAAMAQELHAVLERGLSELPTKNQFSRSMSGYDAYGINLDRLAPGVLGFFVTPEWRDLLSGLFGIGVTPYVFAGAHHHTPAGASGNIHNDLNPLWFPRADRMTIQSPNDEICNFRTGVGRLDASGKVQVVRGVAMIFFLLNDTWRPGEGGETGLYTSAHCAVAEPAVRVPPLNNSLLAFECTPNSYHAYMTSPRWPRTSVIMWVHRPLEEAIEKYGAEKLERWRE